MDGDMTWGGEHTTQCTDEVLWNYVPETWIILLTNKFNEKRKNSFLTKH